MPTKNNGTLPSRLPQAPQRSCTPQPLCPHRPQAGSHPGPTPPPVRACRWPSPPRGTSRTWRPRGPSLRARRQGVGHLSGQQGGRGCSAGGGSSHKGGQPLALVGFQSGRQGLGLTRGEQVVGEVVEREDDGKGGVPAQPKPRHRRHHLHAGVAGCLRAAMPSEAASGTRGRLGAITMAATCACLLRQPRHQAQLAELRRHGHDAAKPEQRVPGLLVRQAVLPAAHACAQKECERMQLCVRACGSEPPQMYKAPSPVRLLQRTSARL